VKSYGKTGSYLALGAPLAVARGQDDRAEAVDGDAEDRVDGAQTDSVVERQPQVAEDTLTHRETNMLVALSVGIELTELELEMKRTRMEANIVSVTKSRTKPELQRSQKTGPSTQRCPASRPIHPLTYLLTEVGARPAGTRCRVGTKRETGLRD